MRPLLCPRLFCAVRLASLVAIPLILICLLCCPLCCPLCWGWCYTAYAICLVLCAPALCARDMWHSAYAYITVPLCPRLSCALLYRLHLYASLCALLCYTTHAYCPRLCALVLYRLCYMACSCIYRSCIMGSALLYCSRLLSSSLSSALLYRL